YTAIRAELLPISVLVYAATQENDAAECANLLNAIHDISESAVEELNAIAKWENTPPHVRDAAYWPARRLLAVHVLAGKAAEMWQNPEYFDAMYDTFERLWGEFSKREDETWAVESLSTV